MLRNKAMLKAVLALTCGVAFSQVVQPVFEVTSVKHHAQGSGYEEVGCSNGRFITRGSPLTDTIRWAYDLKVQQFQQLENESPGWATQEAYDIEAKSGRAVTEAQCRQMVQTLLGHRFKMAIHWESKPGQVYDLVIAKGGSKMLKATDADTGTGFNISLNGRTVRNLAPIPPKGKTMSELAILLANFTQGVPVTDKTGLEGMHKINLAFSMGGAAASDDPDLGTALQMQLGLKLEEHKGAVETFFLDHVERPDPN
jgi:uncharacterized protein (TIGR03435 family)